MDLNKEVESPCKLTSNWGFVGYYLSNGKECVFPIGTFSSYRDGAAHANSWMQQEKRAIRWEGQRLYEPLGEDDGE
jgi:hypothetical protein